VSIYDTPVRVTVTQRQLDELTIGRNRAEARVLELEAELREKNELLRVKQAALLTAEAVMTEVDGLIDRYEAELADLTQRAA
jgi:hypothetical protein